VTGGVVGPRHAESWLVANAVFRLRMDEVRQIDPPRAAMPFIVRDDMYGNMDLT
jgi:hypothetical protein